MGYHRAREQEQTLSHVAVPEPSGNWKRLLAPYARAQNGKAAFQVATTAILFALNWYLMYLSLQGPYWLTLLLALPAAGLSMRLFIFQHDCGHGSFFGSRLANDVLGRVIGVVTLTPYRYWQRTHAIHHGSSGDLDRRSFGDIETLTVAEYLELSGWRRLGYRVYRHPVVLLLVAPAYQFVIKHRFPFDIPLSWRKEWASVMWTNVALLGIGAVAWATIGIGAFVAVQLPITLISGGIGIWLFYVQHQFEDTYWREHSDWSFEQAGIQGSSFYDLPGWLHWFSGNIGFHHIHHLASRIPNYRLAECFRQVPELHKVTRLTLLGSLRSANLHLWSEAEQRLVSFRRAPRRVVDRSLWSRTAGGRLRSTAWGRSASSSTTCRPGSTTTGRSRPWRERPEGRSTRCGSRSLRGATRRSRASTPSRPGA